VLNGLINSLARLVSGGSALTYLLFGLAVAAVVEIARRARAH